MEWSELRDPTGEYDFRAGWTLVSRDYIPEGIQELIDERGVREMVSTVNDHFQGAHGGTALILAWSDGRRVVDDAPAR